MSDWYRDQKDRVLTQTDGEWYRWISEDGCWLQLGGKRPKDLTEIPPNELTRVQIEMFSDERSARHREASELRRLLSEARARIFELEAELKLAAPSASTEEATGR